MIEIILDVSELKNVDDFQKDIVLNWNQSKLNRFLKGQQVGKNPFTIKNVEHIELALFDDEVTLLIIYEQQKLFSNKQDFIKVKFNISSEILIFSWENTYWIVEKQKLK